LRRVIVSFASSVLLLAIASPTFGATTWTRTQLDSSGLDAAPAAAANVSGTIAIVSYIFPSSCCTPFSAGLALSLGSGNSFATSTISTDDYAYPSAAYDGAGILHISAMISGGSGGVAYLEDSAGTVTATTVDTSSLNGRPIIGVDAAGNPRIAYATLTGVSFASSTGGVWSTSEIWTGIALDVAMAVDGGGHDYVVWDTQDPNTGNPAGFYFASDATGSWVISQPTTNVNDTQPSIAVDAIGTVHIVYSHTQPKKEALLELRRVGTTWSTITLLRRAPVDVPVVQIGPNNVEDITYALLSAKGQGQHFLTNATGKFVDSLVDANAGDNGIAALAVAPSGVAYISYDIPGSCCPTTGGLTVAHD
jgi:hypothetical protein